MAGKEWFHFALLIVVAITPKSTYAKQKIADEDIEETSELIVNHLGPLLELNGFTLEDLPSQLKYLTAKYYLIFSRGVEPLETLEKMLSDYRTIENSQQIVADAFGEHIEDFVELNKFNNKKALKMLVTKMLDNFNFSLQVVSRIDAVKFLLYAEAYPDIMEIISLMVSKHYDAYLKERAKEKGHPPKASNHSDTDPNKDEDDFDLTAVVREFVASHGRLELVKRMLSQLEQYLPPFDQTNVSESTLDYLDNLQDFVEMKSNSLWNFMKGSGYTTITSEWINSAEEALKDFLTIVPFQEILNFFDAVALNPNDRRAVIIIRYERSLSRSDQFSAKDTPPLIATSAKDVFDYNWEAIVNGFKIVNGILHDAATGGNSEVSHESFLEYIDELLGPYDMSTNDLSQEMLSIIARTFERINSIEGQSLTDAEEKILNMDLRGFRKNLEKLRDALRILTPEKSESNHIELETMLQAVVNKYGAFASQIEADLVKFFNSRFENPGDMKMVQQDITFFAERLDTMALAYKNSGKKPSEVLRERLSELVQVIDGLVTLTSF